MRLFVILLLQVALSQSLYGQLQKFEIKKMDAPSTAVVQANAQHPDNAMVLVYSSLENLTFRSSMNAINQQRYNAQANRYEILVNPVRQLFFVSRQGFIESQITTLNPSPKEVFYYTVEQKIKGTLIPATIRVTPSDAIVRVDGELVNVAQAVQLTEGAHEVSIKKDGYRELLRELVVTSQTTFFEYTLDKIDMVPVTIKTTPAGATIAISGSEVGISDRNGTYQEFRFPGVYDVLVTMNGYLTKQDRITVKEIGRNEFSFTLERNSGSIKVEVTPSDAQVQLNRRSIAAGTSHEMAPGLYRLEVTKEGHEPYSEDITLERNQALTRSIKLKAYTGTLLFSSTPTDARAELRDAGGRVVATWEGLERRTLSVGSYTVRASASGYQSKEERITIRRDENSSVRMELAESSTTDRNKPTTSTNTGSASNLAAPILQLLADMVYVKGGTFTMGCTSEQGSDCFDNEKPTSRVTVSSFEMGKYEVTQAQWEAVMGSNPSHFRGCPTCPVESVSWNDTQEFILKLNQLTGKQFRLPTEAEWEYAARGGSAGSATKYSGSNNLSSVAWFRDNSGSKTKPVGQKDPNELGLYDMSGNVWEWCGDWYGGYSSSAKTNPTGPGSGSFRVLRGGSWDFNARYCRVSYRNSITPDYRNNYYGFRLVVPR